MHVNGKPQKMRPDSHRMAVWAFWIREKGEKAILLHKTNTCGSSEHVRNYQAIMREKVTVSHLAKKLVTVC